MVALIVVLIIGLVLFSHMWVALHRAQREDERARRLVLEAAERARSAPGDAATRQRRRSA